MKALIVSIALTMASSAFAKATFFCSGKNFDDTVKPVQYVGSYHIKGELLPHNQITNIQSVYVDGVTKYPLKWEMVTEKVVSADANYKPRRYDGYARFFVNVLGLTEGSSWLLLPVNAWTKTEFTAYAPWQWEAGGGTHTLSCKVIHTFN